MRELNEFEIELVSGGDGVLSSAYNSLKGGVVGAIDGVFTGGMLGGSYAGAGGIGFGAVAQLVGTVLGFICGGALGAVVGAIDGPDASAAMLAGYRNDFAGGAQTVVERSGAFGFFG